MSRFPLFNLQKLSRLTGSPSLKAPPFPSSIKTTRRVHLSASTSGACVRAAADLVLENHRINAVPALHTAEDRRNVFAGVIQVIAPVVHEQAVAPNAGSGRELLALHEEPHSLCIPDGAYGSDLLQLMRFDSLFHNSVSRCFLNLISSAAPVTVVLSDDGSMNGS